MSCKSIVYIILSFFVFGSAQAQPQQLYYTEKGVVSFTSDAPLEVISASSSHLKGAIDLENQTFLFVLDNITFKGFNSPLQQEHFYENYIETKKHPRTTFKGKIIEKPVPVPGTTQTVRAKGTFDLHGVVKEQIVKASITYGDDFVVVKAHFNIFLEDYEIRVPKVVSRKIAPEIAITVEAKMPGSQKQKNIQ